jgi:hypothetical protein
MSGTATCSGGKRPATLTAHPGSGGSVPTPGRPLSLYPPLAVEVHLGEHDEAVEPDQRGDGATVGSHQGPPVDVSLRTAASIARPLTAPADPVRNHLRRHAPTLHREEPVYFTQQLEHLVSDLIHPERFRQCAGRNGREFQSLLRIGPPSVELSIAPLDNGGVLLAPAPAFF